MFLKGSWDTATFVTNYLPLILFPILYTGARLWKRVPMVKPEEMDFLSGLAEIEADCYDEPPPRNKMEAFWAWLVSNSALLHFLAVTQPFCRCKTMCMSFYTT